MMSSILVECLLSVAHTTSHTINIREIFGNTKLHMKTTIPTSKNSYNQ